MFNIDIKPEDIDSLVKKTILESAIGQQVSEAINKAIKDALGGYDSPIKKLVNRELTDQITKVLKEEPWRSEINKRIQEKFTADFVGKFVDKCVDKMVKEMENYNDY